MSLQDSQLSPKAIEGFRRREITKRANRRLKKYGLTPTHQAALLRLAIKDHLEISGMTFGLPGDPPSIRIRRQTARELYNRRLVLFVRGPLLCLTGLGREIAEALGRRGET